ncbi:MULTISPECIES: hypothetical protein [unclassified Rhodanobacter]|uniref:hypothetical protein n=1 Tax=unclassified Rhodanobacter TaxID=2621553 RepID=UPI001BDFA901|nr:MULTISPECIES: hypothetical protein [unclassified Rhodanobacter]MBT2145283.1 hypothetical protein [Rhodanobacter sp. LX-99]MBT2149328.1 hypothetical protein [Rhodanobacter sp. LX-100]
MPAKRKPAALQELNGAWRKDPQRRRIQPTATGPIGAPPKQSALTFEQAWRYLVKCAPDGVLADRDRVWLEVAAHLLLQFRADPANMHPAKLSRLTACLSALGLSPADASRVVVAPAKPEHSDFD